MTPLYLRSPLPSARRQRPCVSSDPVREPPNEPGPAARGAAPPPAARWQQREQQLAHSAGPQPQLETQRRRRQPARHAFALQRPPHAGRGRRLPAVAAASVRVTGDSTKGGPIRWRGGGAGRRRGVGAAAGSIGGSAGGRWQEVAGSWQEVGALLMCSLSRQVMSRLVRGYFPLVQASLCQIWHISARCLGETDASVQLQGIKVTASLICGYSFPAGQRSLTCCNRNAGSGLLRHMKEEQFATQPCNNTVSQLVFSCSLLLNLFE